MRINPEELDSNVHARIAYIVGRLIAGKDVTSVYDYSRSRLIRISSLPDAGQLKTSNYLQWVYLSGSSDITRYQYACEAGDFIDLSIKGRTFIGYVHASSSHFIGTVRGDSIYLYDQQQSRHFTYRLTGSSVAC